MKAIAILAAATLTAAGTPDGLSLMPDEYSIFCQGTLSTGLNWENDSWVYARYVPENYIVMRSKENQCSDVTDESLLEVSDGIWMRNVCLNIRKVGTAVVPWNSFRCVERYMDTEITGMERSFSCDNTFGGRFSGRFDGLFHRSNTHNDFRDRTNYKDSQVVEVGQCSQVA